MINQANKEIEATTAKEASSRTFRVALFVAACSWGMGLTDYIAKGVSNFGSILPEESIITKLLVSFGVGYTIAILHEFKRKHPVKALAKNLPVTTTTPPPTVDAQSRFSNSVVYGSRMSPVRTQRESNVQQGSKLQLK